MMTACGVKQQQMPRKDIYHDTVVAALVADGWTITDDPLHLPYGEENLYVDLGAENMLAAEKSGQKIAVEIKTFVGHSDIHELEVALGQYNLYRDVLRRVQPERQLYLAVTEVAYERIFQYPIGLLVLEEEKLRLLVFDEDQARIVKWIPSNIIANK